MHRLALGTQEQQGVQRTMVTVPFLLCYILRTAKCLNAVQKQKAFNLLRVLASVTKQAHKADQESVPWQPMATKNSLSQIPQLSKLWADDVVDLSAQDIQFEYSWPAQLWVLAKALAHPTVRAKDGSKWPNFHGKGSPILEGAQMAKGQLIAQDIIYQVSNCLDTWATGQRMASIQEIVAARTQARKRKRAMSLIVPALLNKSKQPKLCAQEQSLAAKCQIHELDNKMRGNLLHAQAVKRQLLGLDFCQLRLKPCFPRFEFHCSMPQGLCCMEKPSQRKVLNHTLRRTVSGQWSLRWQRH